MVIAIKITVYTSLHIKTGLILHHKLNFVCLCSCNKTLKNSIDCTWGNAEKIDRLHNWFEQYNYVMCVLLVMDDR